MLKFYAAGHRDCIDSNQLQAALVFLQQWKPKQMLLTLISPFEEFLALACQEQQIPYVVYCPGEDCERHMPEPQAQEHQYHLQCAERVEFVNKKTNSDSERLAYTATKIGAEVLVTCYDGRYGGRCEGLITEALKTQTPVLNYHNTLTGEARPSTSLSDPWLLHNTQRVTKGWDALCIPTTCSLKKSTSQLAIPETTLAAQAQERNPLFAREAGRLYKESGAQAYYLKEMKLLTFPIQGKKEDAPEKARILASAGQALKLADTHKLKKIALPWGSWGPPQRSCQNPLLHSPLTTRKKQACASRSFNKCSALSSTNASPSSKCELSETARHNKRQDKKRFLLVLLLCSSL